MQNLLPLLVALYCAGSLFCAVCCIAACVLAGRCDEAGDALGEHEQRVDAQAAAIY